MAINTITISGRLTAEPELRVTGSDKKVISFTIANDKGKDKEPNWIDCVAWEQTAEFIGRLHKGDKVTVEGRLDTRPYNDAKGNKRKATEVTVNHIEAFVAKTENTPAVVENSGEYEIPTEDLPF